MGFVHTKIIFQAVDPVDPVGTKQIALRHHSKLAFLELLYIATGDSPAWCWATTLQLTHLLGIAFKHHILLALVQPPLLHGPEVQNPVLSLQQLVQDGCREERDVTAGVYSGTA